MVVLNRYAIKILRFVAYICYWLISRLVDKTDLAEEGSYRTELKSRLIGLVPRIGQEILEVGSGTWEWTKIFFTSNNRHVLTFDRSPSPGIDVAGNLYDLEKHFPTSSFDAVICTDVIEHVPQPFAAVKQLAAVLKSGGLLFVSCPFDKELHGEDYGDYWRFTRQGWLTILQPEFKEVNISWLGLELKPKAYFITAIKK